MPNPIPRHILWSTDRVDTSDPFQWRWLLRQTLMYGRAEDIRRLDFAEIKRELDHLDLPPDIDNLWRAYFDRRNDRRSDRQEGPE